MQRRENAPFELIWYNHNKHWHRPVNISDYALIEFYELKFMKEEAMEHKLKANKYFLENSDDKKDTGLTFEMDEIQFHYEFEGEMSKDEKKKKEEIGKVIFE